MSSYIVMEREVSQVFELPSWIAIPGALLLMFFLLKKDDVDKVIDEEPHLEIWPAKKRILTALGAACAAAAIICGLFSGHQYSWLLVAVGGVMLLLFIHHGVTTYYAYKALWELHHPKQAEELRSKLKKARRQ